VAISLTSDFQAGLPDSLNIVPEWLLGFALGSGVAVKHRKRRTRSYARTLSTPNKTTNLPGLSPLL
jgi:hypothetical protein